MLISSAIIIRSLFAPFINVTLPSGIEEDIGYVVMANEAQEVTYNFMLAQTIFGDYDESENN